uniref:Uncharacterized protein n=1 Tax=Rhizophora mucronata TaxID=61149 RepID=A0A2P2NSI4_RHIMU
MKAQNTNCGENSQRSLLESRAPPCDFDGNTTIAFPKHFSAAIFPLPYATFYL